jgi:NitT/TauT family transport system permease protein
MLSGGVLGLLLGAWMGWSRPVRLVVDPFVAAFHPVPKISILPLLMIVFGIGEAPKIILVALAAFFPLLLNTMTAVRQINPLHLEVARHYGATGIKLVYRVILPASLPLILIGVRLAINSALVITIAVELLSARTGLGAVIWLAWQTLRTEELYVALFATALIGIGIHRSLQFCERNLIHW